MLAVSFLYLGQVPQTSSSYTKSQKEDKKKHIKGSSLGLLYFGVSDSPVSEHTLNYRLSTKINHSNSYQLYVCMCVCVCACGFGSVLCFTFFIAYFAAPKRHDSILSHFMAALKAMLRNLHTIAKWKVEKCTGGGCGGRRGGPNGRACF